jgi:hypothetical protein
VEVHAVNEARLTEIATAAGVPPDGRGCHTAQIGGYVVEGHVPVEDIRRLLREKPAIAGLTVPGMLAGTPGMGPAPAGSHYEVMAIGRDGSLQTYARH